MGTVTEAIWGAAAAVGLEVFDQLLDAYVTARWPARRAATTRTASPSVTAPTRRRCR